MPVVSLTVGKVDAGVTVLLTDDKRLIEFPSILLPSGISSGSIVDIAVSRNLQSEREAIRAFEALQTRILTVFGTAEPQPPALRCLNATQTSVVLEWDPMQLATADLLSLSLYRNGTKAGGIPNPLRNTSSKISGLGVDTEYSFHLVLRTTAGTLPSEPVVVRTHKMSDLTGVTITTGILPPAARSAVAAAVARVGARVAEEVRIDTTHFVTTEGRGLGWEKAVETNIPVVRPEWIDACERAGRILGVTKFYLDAVRPGPPAEDMHLNNSHNQPSPQPQSQRQSATTPAVQKALQSRPADDASHTQQGRSTTPTEADASPVRASREAAAAVPEPAQKVLSPRADEQQGPLADRPASKQKPNLQALSGRGRADDEHEEDGKHRHARVDDDDEPAEAAEAKVDTPSDGASFQDVAL